MRKTKIIATFGPATDDRNAAEAALGAGVNVVRFNFSHGDHDAHLRRCRTVREIADEMGRPVAVLADLQGPKIRTGELKEASVELVEGARFIITMDKSAGDEKRVSTNYDRLPEEISVGDPVLIDDGKIRLLVREVRSGEVVTEVVNGGPLKPRKAINLPGVRLSVPSITEKDVEDLHFAVEQLDADFVALSVVRRADDIRRLKKLLNELNSGAGVIAKIEKPEAVENIDEIMGALDLGDGVMVARGDLGVEVDFRKIPAIQKELLARANKRGLISITATQMLESMMTEPMPSRAEATDIFNAILDGSDALMLSGETAAGRHPAAAVRAMAAIIEEAEDFAKQSRTVTIEPTFCDNTFALATTKAASSAAETAGARGIVAITRSGRTALLMSKLALPMHIPFYALTFDEHTLRKMALYYGVIPLPLPRLFDPAEGTGVWEMVDEALLGTNALKRGDTIVIASGYRTVPGSTNACKIVKLGQREYY